MLSTRLVHSTFSRVLNDIRSGKWDRVRKDTEAWLEARLIEDKTR